MCVFHLPHLFLIEKEGSGLQNLTLTKSQWNNVVLPSIQKGMKVVTSKEGGEKNKIV